MSQYHMKKIQHKLKKELDENRYEHTLGVRYTCAALAMRYHYDLEKAQAAGLLHDCAKCISDKQKMKICRKNHIEISQAEEESPFLLHAKVQAMADNVEETLGKAGVNPKQIEGYQTANWVLLDYGDVIVHVFDEENRLFYDLERIWRDGKSVEVEEL